MDEIARMADDHTMAVQAWLSTRAPQARRFEGLGVTAGSSGLAVSLLNLALGGHYPPGTSDGTVAAEIKGAGKVGVIQLRYCKELCAKADRFTAVEAILTDLLESNEAAGFPGVLNQKDLAHAPLAEGVPDLVAIIDDLLRATSFGHVQTLSSYGHCPQGRGFCDARETS